MKVITVAAAIIINEQQQLLLVRKQGTQCFMQVGGKLEVGEAADQTLLREIAEEIGCKAEIQQFIGRFESTAANEAGHKLVAYIYHVTLVETPSIQAEIAEMRWLDLAQHDLPLAPLTEEVVLPWVHQYLHQPA